MFFFKLTLFRVPCPCAEPGAALPVETAEEGAAETAVGEPPAETVVVEERLVETVEEEVAGTVAVEHPVETAAAGLPVEIVVVEVVLVGTAVAEALPVGTAVAEVVLVETVAVELLAEIAVGFVEVEDDPEVVHPADTDWG